MKQVCTHRNPIPALILSALLAAPVTAQAASGPSVKVLCKRIEAVGRALQAYHKQRARRLDLLKRLRQTAAQLQKRAPGPARDYRLRTVMAEARQNAAELTRLDRRIAMAASLKRRMQRMARKMPAVQARKLRGCIERAMPAGRTKSSKRGRLAQVKLHPLDGPREIKEKADLLADSADKLQKRLRSLKRAIRRVEKQVALRKAARRAEGSKALWGASQPSRLTARTSKTPSVRSNVPPAQGGPAAPHDTSLTNDQDDGMYADPVAAGEMVGGRSSGGTVSVRTVWERTIGALRDLTDPSTAAALSKAMRSGDLATRLSALKKARRILAQKTAELRRKSKRFRKKAAQLRKKERK